MSREWDHPLTEDEIAMHALRAVVSGGDVAHALADLDSLNRSVVDAHAFALLQRLVNEYRAEIGQAEP